MGGRTAPPLELEDAHSSSLRHLLGDLLAFLLIVLPHAGRPEANRRAWRVGSATAAAAVASISFAYAPSILRCRSSAAVARYSLAA